MRFTIPAIPVAKGRPKISAIGGHARAYTPAKTRKYEEMVGLIARTVFPKPLKGPVYLRAEFYFEHPKAKWRKRKPLEQTWHTGRPDVDNLMKSLLDGLEGVAFGDDSSVVWVVGRKYRACQGDSARTEVEVAPASLGEGER